jgi:two-component system response regulator PilR (NtrC family)
MTEPQALIVDDEPDICELLEITLGRMGISTVAASTLGRARSALREHDFDLCLTDMRLPDGNGIDFVKYLQRESPEVPVAMITAHGNVESAVEALKAGAFDFISKPVDLQSLRDVVKTALRLNSRRGTTGQKLIGSSEPMEQTRARIRKLARSQAPVYISGESGTGKELVARMIHEQGPRAEQAFVPVNCGAIPNDLIESELFGHVRGSFTGAISDNPGLFQSATGGTLFLDEVAELPLPMQVKLLRAIQEKCVRPVGAQSEVKVDVRVLSATHRALAELVAAGTFRQDLYYRINVIEIVVPALRERSDDIAEIAGHILRRLSEQWGEAEPAVAPDAMALLERYPFPGNVRELENVLERAFTLCEGGRIVAADLGLPDATRIDEGGSEAAELDVQLESVERARILEALDKTRWNKTAAARELGITFRALRYRLKKFALE